MAFAVSLGWTAASPVVRELSGPFPRRIALDGLQLLRDGAVAAGTARR